jgi:hypothetical protein
MPRIDECSTSIAVRRAPHQPRDAERLAFVAACETQDSEDRFSSAVTVRFVKQATTAHAVVCGRRTRPGGLLPAVQGRQARGITCVDLRGLCALEPSE